VESPFYNTNLANFEQIGGIAESVWEVADRDINWSIINIFHLYFFICGHGVMQDSCKKERQQGI